ncbi:Phosphatidate cytidylyltransferase [Nymphaea thermarum]|nr:Phosphatidate cytidylyltransferase [Nymphaea thermarum]
MGEGGRESKVQSISVPNRGDTSHSSGANLAAAFELFLRVSSARKTLGFEAFFALFLLAFSSFSTGLDVRPSLKNVSGDGTMGFKLKRNLGSFSISIDMMGSKEQLAAPLQQLPPVDFCCVYGSSLLPSTQDKKPMVDYILGVSDPEEWHLKITQIAEQIGVGVHFNPFVQWKDKVLKYGVIRMHDLVNDVLKWEKFYVSGRLQKPVCILVDTMDVAELNLANLKAATSAALLLLPSEFSEEDLYAKICSLSYMGDLRMLFAEDKNKVKNIVGGRFDSFRSLYMPTLKEYAVDGLLTLPSSNDSGGTIMQDHGLSATRSLVFSLPQSLRRHMGAKLGEKHRLSPTGRVIHEVIVPSRAEASKCMQKILRRQVMVSSARQAVAGVLSAGGMNAARYLANKMFKAWKSRV